jgi:hypothetical protein
MTRKLIITGENSVKVIKVNPKLRQGDRTEDISQHTVTRTSCNFGRCDVLSDPYSSVVECDVLRLETGYKPVLEHWNA